VSVWNEMGLIHRLMKHKLIFVETKDFNETTFALENYKKACDNGRGRNACVVNLFVCVCVYFFCFFCQYAGLNLFCWYSYYRGCVLGIVVLVRVCILFCFYYLQYVMILFTLRRQEAYNGSCFRTPLGNKNA